MSRWDELTPYRRAGYDLIPLIPPTSGDPTTGKRPRFAGWREDRYPDEQLRLLFGLGHNLGVRLRSDHLVVDVDPRNFPEPTAGTSETPLTRLETDIGVRLRDIAPCVQTGSGGFHFYLRKPADVPVVDSLGSYPGVEFKSVGRQVVAAGSIHFSGETYRWHRWSRDLGDAPVVPESLLRLIRRPPPRKIDGAGELTVEEVVHCLEQLDPVEHSTHDRWFGLLCACHFATAGEARYEFVNWSAQNPDFAHLSWEVGRRWDSLSVERDSSQITTGTLFQRVLEAGGELPPGRAANDFDPVEENDEGVAEEGDRLLNWMNARHCCACDDDGRFRIYSLRDDRIHGGRRWQARTKRDFEDTLANRRVQVQGKIEPLSRWWLLNRKRRQYETVLFDPEREHEGCLNLWTGWAVEPRPGDWSRLRGLVEDELVHGSEEGAHYVWNWLAWMIQHPGKPAETALVFQGRKGTGKGTLGEAFLAIAGRHGLRATHRTHLFGRFNAALRDKIFVFGDEVFWPGDHQGEAVLKTLITEPTAFYEAKGVDGSMGRNHVHLIMAANADWVVPARMDGERRFAIFRVPDKVPSRAYFDRLYRQIYEEGGLGAMLYDLQRRDLGDWHPRYDLPQTAALWDQKLRSLDEVEEWWFDMLMHGALPGIERAWNGACVEVPARELQESLSVHCGKVRGSRRALSTRLGMVLRRFVPEVRRHRKRYGTEREVVYVMPPLEQCRGAFIAEVGHGISWSDLETWDVAED